MPKWGRRTDEVKPNGDSLHGVDKTQCIEIIFMEASKYYDLTRIWTHVIMIKSLTVL